MLNDYSHYMIFFCFLQYFSQKKITQLSNLGAIMGTQFLLLLSLSRSPLDFPNALMVFIGENKPEKY